MTQRKNLLSTLPCLHKKYENSHLQRDEVYQILYSFSNTRYYSRRWCKLKWSTSEDSETNEFPILLLNIVLHVPDRRVDQITPGYYCTLPRNMAKKRNNISLSRNSSLEGSMDEVNNLLYFLLLLIWNLLLQTLPPDRRRLTQSLQYSILLQTWHHLSLFSDLSVQSDHNPDPPPQPVQQGCHHVLRCLVLLLHLRS